MSDRPDCYIFLKDIAEKYDMSSAGVRYHVNKLRSEGYLELDLKKTKIARSVTISSAKVYRPTRQVLKDYDMQEFYGGARENLSKLTGGPKDFELQNVHGDLVYKYEVKETPGTETIEWDRVNDMKNGVTQKIKYLQNDGGEGTIEMFQGKNSTTITLKPRLQGTSTDELEERLNSLSWGIYRDLQRNGYEIGVPERRGEAKFTLISDTLPDEYREGENYLVDHSRGEKELHPRTGDFEANAEMAKMLENTGYMAKAAKKIEEVADSQDHEELRQQVNQQAQVILQQREAIQELTDQVGTMSQSINKLGNALSEALEGQEQSYDPPEMNNGGPMYG